jgi:hypothetical protein
MVLIMPEGIVIRNHSKIIFFYPLMIYCLVAFIIEKVHEVQNPGAQPLSQLGWLFVIFLFMNLYVTTFDMSLKSFIILIVIGVLLFVILALTGVINFSGIAESDFQFDMPINSNIFLVVLVMLAVLILLGILQSRFNFIEIEKQEVQIHGFLESGLRQYNASDMSYEIEFGDIFEFLAARAGTLTLRFKDGKVIILDTVLNLKKVKAQLDEIRNSVAVKVQNP